MKFLLSVSLVLIFSSFSVFAQVKNYDAQWKTVNDLLEKKNLPKSALEEVKKIYTTAKRENQDAQVIKALSYMVILQHQTRENSQILSIAEIEKEIAITKEPAASILKSLLANSYFNYLQQNRYRFYGRTNTVDFNKNDIATWTLEDLHKKISELYLQSIRNENVLKQTKLEPFDAIISKGNVRYLRPTLYDLLAHQALTYFQNSERDIKKPAYAFEINQPQAFAPAAIFTDHRFTTRDSLSLQHKALQIYQELIDFHLKDAKPDALIDVDIHRIQFVYGRSVAENKDSLYLAALKNIVQKYPRNATAMQASFLLAQWYEQKAGSYSPSGDTTHRYSRILARNILEEVIKDSSIKSEGWINSMNLLKQIMQFDFSFEVERVNVPGKPFRALVRYRNIAVLNFRVIKADESMKADMEDRYGDKYWATLINTKPLKSWQQNLPATNDLQQHAVEIKIDELPIGEYYLIASSSSNFALKKATLGSQLFYVSNIGYVNQNDQYFVLHRETGQPLVNANVDVYGRQYNYNTYKYNRVKLGTHKTDDKGFFKSTYQKQEKFNEFYLDITHQNDRLNLRESIYRYYDRSERAPEKQAQIKTFFFTDRSIYRPGQIVYFKGIAISSLNDKNEVAANHKTTIYLRDRNYQITDSLQVTTNEFGSYSGKFQLPQNQLNGEFTILDKGQTGNARFSVEEYKRPKFYVEFDKIKNSYKVNETVTVSGSVKAYAGNNIDGAKVSYRVVRKPRFIYRWYFTKSWLPPVEEMEIAHGEVITYKDGKFTIQFTAIPDKKLDPKTDPVFDYAIHADVTDINGETRSGDKTVTAGYKSLILQVDLPEKLHVDSFRQVIIRSENMNGEFQKASIELTVRKLIPPDNRLIRPRYWQEPDQFVMTKEEYVRIFPHDEYKNETDYKTWDKGDVVMRRADTSSGNGMFALPTTSLTIGYYVIEVTTRDKDGKEIKDTKYVELYNPSDNSFIKPEYLWATSSDEVVEPGSKTQMQIGSSAQNVFLVQQIDKVDKSKNSLDFNTLNSEKKTFTYSATEEDRGGFGVNFFFIKDNRVYQFNDAVNVPWTNKDLSIEFSTFRDKTLPGSEEKWKVKLTGYKNEKLAAEMLASMYDASLDQFKPHSWTKPRLWSLYSQQNNWTGFSNFVSVQSDMKQVYEEFLENKKQYDWFSFGIYGDSPRPPVVYKRARNGIVGEEDVMGNFSAPVAQAEAADSNSNYNMPQNKVAVDFTFSTGSGTAEKVNQQQIDPTIQPRKNFQETAFFFPDLRTDENGNIEFSFTAPEALTKWKLQTLAHTKGLAFGFASNEMVTQKELMVQPNMTRFLRQGDRMELVAKIVNMSDKELTGQAQLQLFDATTNQSVDGWFINSFPNQYFTVAAGQSEVVKFPIQVPFQFTNALTWRITARSGNFTDGEEEAVAVLTNKTIVTETLPLPMRGSGTKNFSFEKLLKSGNSETLQHHALTVEYTSNPAWYAVQALPYLMEYPYECAEQVWNRYYANALAAKIANASPRIKNIFSQWAEADTAALLSNLQKNQELKSALLEETPWVLQAKTEAEQKKNIALLFDMVRMSKEMSGNLEKLQSMQSSNGGFVWFTGGPDDRYITQYIVTGIGHLKKLGVDVSKLNSILNKAIPYLDKKIKEDYDNLVKRKADLKKQQIGYYEIQYLYMRSFFPENKIAAATQTAYNFYKKQSQQFWVKQNKYMQGMIALSLNRSGDKQTPVAILKSLDENSIKHEELGMYWKENTFGYSWNWWYAPIETHSLMIEAFSEIGNDVNKVDDLRTWLIKNKQTNNWRTTKATADACYAMLLQGTNLLDNEPDVQITLGSSAPLSARSGAGGEAGTGYFKHTIEGEKINPQMGNIAVTVQQSNNPTTGQPINAPSWGSVYWQYFEDLDKITTASTPLQLNKKLFIEKNTDRGPVLSPVADGTELHVGDKIKVRIELRVDRDMEYVHMKDMRASALEPVNVLSGYKWQGGLGYYESTKDASTNFFFNYLRKGTYVFEYALFVSHTGNFSNGITTIQCMYAPEFTAHSEGVRISVE